MQVIQFNKIFVKVVCFFSSGELVQDEINGRIFTSGEELAAILLDWFADFPSASHPRHVLFRRNLAAFRELGWHDNWRFAALPVFQAGCSHQANLFEEKNFFRF
jgi:hypothetical protein